MINTQLNYLSILTGGLKQDDVFSYVNAKTSVPAKSVHQSLVADQLEKREEIAASSQVKRDMRAFREAVAKADNLEQALADPTVHKVMSSIYEVEILQQSPDRFAKIMMTDPDDPTSLLGRTRDKGLIAMGKDFKAAGDTLGLLKDTEYQEAIENSVVSIQFEAAAALTSPAAADAFYFERKASTVDTPMDILANPRLRDVVYGALGFSDRDKALPIEEQYLKLAGALDFQALEENDHYVRDIAVTYLNNMDRQQSPDTGALSILGGGGGLVNILS
ncbi:DUF1217 domain-containing protein [Aestuariispira insulae]|nr:DUF1217 domain-containing protein [Aestuariispira insulae]